jgi:hypothetical protein
VCLDNRKAVLGCEVANRGEVCCVGPIQLFKLLPWDILARALAMKELAYSILQVVTVTGPEKYGDFQSLRGIGLADRFRAPNRMTFAAFEKMVCHSTNPVLSGVRLRDRPEGGGGH